MKNKTYFLLIGILFTMLVQNVNAQANEYTAITKNSIYVEMFGSAGYIYNISYDRIVFAHKKSKVSAAMGLQYIPDGYGNDEVVFSCSPQINYMYGIKHHFETGIGIAAFNTGEYVIPIRIGYRYQTNEEGMFYKVALTPVYIDDFFGSAGILPWGGFAIGWSF